MKTILVVLVLWGLFAPQSGAACTGVALVREGAVVVGVNEDNSITEPALWATRASDSAHGVVYLGLYFVGLGNRLPGWYEMQGVNDEGLFYDLFSIPCAPGTYHPPRATWPEPGMPMPEAIERTMMTTCATVEEALAFLHKRKYARILPCVQVLLADRAGNAAVYTGTEDVFRTGPGFVVTNFDLANRSLGGWPCERYSLASRLIALDAGPTLDRAAQLLRATRYVAPPGSSEREGGTRYSMTCDLVSGVADVYVGGDFSKRARLDLAALWRAGQERVPLAELLFSPCQLP